MTRKLALAVSSSLLAFALVVPVASAAQPTKTTQPFSASLDRPAGTVCDFELFETFTGTDVVTSLRSAPPKPCTVTHTNRDMGYTLTESYVTNFTGVPGLTQGSRNHLPSPRCKREESSSSRLGTSPITSTAPLLTVPQISIYPFVESSAQHSEAKRDPRLARTTGRERAGDRERARLRERGRVALLGARQTGLVCGVPCPWNGATTTRRFAGVARL